MMYKNMLSLSLLGIAVLAHAANAATPKLDLNDVSWLWPVPESVDDLSSGIAMDQLKSATGEAVWSDEQFADLLNAINSGATKVDDVEIELSGNIAVKRAWHLAGVRVDPSAPGCSDEIRDAFGSRPQIRLIAQPVTVADGIVTVHDVAVHLVYEWTLGEDERRRKIPDDEKLADIVAGLDAVKAATEQAGASTAGKPLGVHPGIAAHESVRKEAAAFLTQHLTHDRLASMAIMGLPPNGIEPWIFFATTRLPDGRFGPIPVPVPAAAPQMIDFRSRDGVVRPAPLVHNRAAITAAPIIPVEERRGVATAVLFERFDSDAFAVIGVQDGSPVHDVEVRNRDIADVIANPLLSHFVNTDCVSCHTETRRRISLQLTPGAFAFTHDGTTVPIAADVLPQHDWNVRNFGWFPPHRFIGGGRTTATVTQRTANESAEVVEFIERNFRSAN